MAPKPGQEAFMPNPALQVFRQLVGDWRTTGTHPYVPGVTFHGETSFDWIEGGAFLIMHSQIDEPAIPTGIAIFGSDDSTKEYYMLYFDERGVSRKYDVSIQDNVWKWWRNAPDFSQRFTITILDNGGKMSSQGEMSRDGSAWEKDLELTYTRM